MTEKELVDGLLEQLEFLENLEKAEDKDAYLNKRLAEIEEQLLGLGVTKETLDSLKGAF